jgi:hypothetical protein
MRHACFYVPWLIPVYSWKSPLETAADFGFGDGARRLGAARTGASLWGAKDVATWKGVAWRRRAEVSRVAD